MQSIYHKCIASAVREWWRGVSCFLLLPWFSSWHKAKNVLHLYRLPDKFSDIPYNQWQRKYSKLLHVCRNKGQVIVQLVNFKFLSLNFDKFDPNYTSHVPKTSAIETNYLSAVNIAAWRPLSTTVVLILY